MISRFRGSPRFRRLGALTLGTFVAVYLVLITAAWESQALPWHGVGLLIALWAVGLVAFAILVRGYRRAARDSAV
jgi:hypothetical protein